MNLETASLDIDTTIYPDSDGKPIADNTRQLQMIFKLYGNIRTIHEDMMDVFVAGDHLIYPIKKDNKTRIAPDVYVAYGRPDHHRGSYKVWMENNIFPQVVVEVLSPKNSRKMMQEKRAFYERYKCEEYIEIEPVKETLTVWVREKNMRKLRQVSCIPEWTSPRMGVRFVPETRSLKMYTPSGTIFRSFQEVVHDEKDLKARFETALKRADRAERRNVKLKKRLNAEAERANAEAERANAEAERANAEAERADAEARGKAAATTQADQYRAKLIELGIDPDT